MLRYVGLLFGLCALLPMVWVLPAAAVPRPTTPPPEVAVRFSAQKMPLYFRQRLNVVRALTQPTLRSQQEWVAARNNIDKWNQYQLNWTTDYCSVGPNKPLGFDFELACARHDFGYRNYRRLDLPQYKSEIDGMFYGDLQRICLGQTTWDRPSCMTLAWTYFRAVRKFGSIKTDGTAMGVVHGPVRKFVVKND